MVVERTTPEDELEPQAVDTPEGEPVDEPTAEDRPDQSVAPAVIAQAEYTRATQLAAAIRRELGLPKSATQAEVIAAVQARQAAEQAEETEEEELDPRIVQAQERAFQAQMRVVHAVYGEQFASDALELINAVRTSDDIEELITQIAGFRDTHAPASDAPQAATAPPPAEPAEASPADIDMSEGERATPVQSTPSGRRESGVVGALRGIFEAAGAASRPR